MSHHNLLERTVHVTGGNINYVEMNSESQKKELILLIHGISANWRDWKASMLGEISRLGYRTIAIDRPGMGNSIRSLRTITLQDQASLITESIRAISSKPLIIIGHSYGGSLGLRMTITNPKDIKGLLLLSAPTHPWSGGLGLLYDTLGLPFLTSIGASLVSLFKPKVLVDSTLRDVFHPQSVPSDYKQLLNVNLTLRKESLEWIIKDAKELKFSLAQMSTTYKEINTPVEIIHGIKDKIVPFELHAKQLNEQIPSSNLIQLDEIGHMPHHFKKNTILQSLVSLLAKK